MTCHKTYEEGEILFTEGDPSDYVVRIEEGTVDVLRELGGKTIALGAVAAGEFLGEMGVVEGKPRSATARAATAVEAEILQPDVFIAQVSSEPEVARELITRLSARLRSVEDRLVKAVEGTRTKAKDQPSASTSAGPQVEIVAASPALEQQMGAAARRVPELPFLVGRKADKEEFVSSVPLDLTIRDEEPHRLSLAHFIVLMEYDVPVVRDLASELGTIVNGRCIGLNFSTDVAGLETGANEVIAGGEDSPYRFSINVQ